MARTKNRPAARSAAHAAPDPAPAPGTAPDPGSPAAAVHAALAANPGSTVTGVATAAGIGTPAARAALLALEKDGTATRVKGTKPGTPDTWGLAGPAPDGTSPATDPEAGQPGQPGDDETASSTGQDRTAETGHAPAPAGGSDEQDSPSDAPTPGTAEPGPHDDAPAADGHENTVPDEQDDEAAPGSDGPQDPDDGHASHEDTPADAGDAPDPALVTDLTARITQITAAADATTTALSEDTDLRAALAGLDEIADQAAQARRELKAAIGGRKTSAARPGGLRERVLAHLNEHPDDDFTPHEIHKVLGNSSGAIANALDKLAALGEAELACEKPRRFRRIAQPDGTPDAGTADGAKRDRTELAGAA